MGLDHVLQEVVIKGVYGAEPARCPIGMDGGSGGGGGSRKRVSPSSGQVGLNIVFLRHKWDRVVQEGELSEGERAAQLVGGEGERICETEQKGFLLSGEREGGEGKEGR